MCMYFFSHAFVRDMFMFSLAPTIHCILTNNVAIALNIVLKLGVHLQLVCAWFLEITFVREVSMHIWMCVCVGPPGYERLFT